MNYDFIKRIMLLILGFLIIMILISYGVNKGEVQEESVEETDVVEGSYINEDELYIINPTDVYDYFDTYDNAELCLKKVSDELVRYGSELNIARLTNIECAEGILIFNIENADVDAIVNDAFKVTVSREGTAIERLS